MALVYPDLLLLIAARERGARCERIATIGRLKLFLHRAEVRKLARTSAAGDLLEHYAWGDWCEPYLAGLLGAREVVSIDVSDHDAATHIMDLNHDIPPQYKEGFDLVIDGGTLEHVFNYPVAVANLMRMVQVRDPAEVGCRVMVTSGRCLMIRCLSRRTQAVAPFTTVPQQSDYQVMWQGEATARTTAAATEGRGLASSMLRRLYRQLPELLRMQIAERRLDFSLSNREFFRPWGRA
jgi:hypothetical protein